MRNPFTLTFILALFVAGLGAYVYFVDIPQSQEALKQEDQERRLIPFDDRSISHMTFTTPKETIVLMRDGKRRWHITEPIATPADSREVRKILRALTIGKIQRVILDAEDNQEQYGLDPPQVTLTLTAGGRSEEIEIGKRAPLTSTLYARKRSDGQTLLTTLNPLTFSRKTLFIFRKKEILSFDSRQVEEFQLERGKEQVILHRQPGAHGLSPNWSFRAPIQGPADRTTVGLLLGDLGELQAKGFVDSASKKTALLKSLGPPKAKATIHSRTRQYTVSFFQSSNIPDTYAMTKKDNPLYRIEPTIVNELTKGLFHLRDKRLLGMETKDLAILAVKNSSDSYALINQSGTWVLEDDLSQTLNQEVIRLFASRVVDLPAEFRIAIEETGLTQWGLSPPLVEIQATDLKGQERGRILLGNSKKGLVYAMGAGLPGVHQARSNILTQIPSRQDLLIESGNP